MKVLTIVGARPQFIKASALSRVFRDLSSVEEVLVHTGQHHDPEMSAIFFDELEIPPPRHTLGIHGGTHGDMTGRMLIHLERVAHKENPDAILVYGDTNSTLAGALAAAKLDVPLAHVEAGLRSFRRSQPEEINRRVTDHLSDLLFCPTSTSVANLTREGIDRGVHQVGDVMYDATLFAADQAETRSTILEQLGLARGQYKVATVHRAENTDEPHRLERVLTYVRDQARGETVVLPLHPRTRAAASAARITLEDLRVVPPMGYLDMVRLVAHANAVLTDSGGLQKEAYFHRVPCVTLRDETEWVETIEAGWNRLWTDPEYMPRVDIDEYGGGKAAEEIAGILATQMPAA